jgi:hypothetical protein
MDASFEEHIITFSIRIGNSLYILAAKQLFLSNEVLLIEVLIVVPTMRTI